MRANIFFLILIAIMAGCGLGSHFFGFVVLHSVEVLTIGVIAFVVFTVAVVRQGTWNHILTGLLFGMLFIGSVLYGSVRGLHARDEMLAMHAGETLMIMGTVISDPEIKGTRERFVMRINRAIIDDENILVDDKATVSVPRYPGVAYGDRIELTASLEVPEPFDTEYGRTFAYDNYLRSQGIGYTVFAEEFELVEKETASPITSALLKTKHALLNSIRRVMHEPFGSVAAAMVFGEKSGIPEKLQTQFQQSGLIHIMVLSGYNITIIAVALLAMTRPLGRKFGIAVSAIAIIAFLLMTGLTPTSTRAGIMGGIGLLALGTFRRSDPLRALFLAGAVMAIINPFLVLDSVSFQLSFLATIGLILFTPLLTFIKIPEQFGLRETIASTLATQIAVLPLLLGSVGMLSFVGIVANLFVVPMVPFIMLLTAITAVTGIVFVPIASVFGYVTELLTRFIVWIVEQSSRVQVISFADISAIAGYVIGLVISIVIVVVLYILRKRGLIY